MLAAIKLSEWIGMSTALIGTVVSVVALLLQQRQRAAESRTNQARARLDEVDRWEAERLSRARTVTETSDARSEASLRRADAEDAYKQAKRKEPSRRRWSYKAGASAVLGILTLFGALLLLSLADLTGESVTTEDILGVLFWAAIAVLWDSARGEISSPIRSGVASKWLGQASSRPLWQAWQQYKLRPSQGPSHR